MSKKKKKVQLIEKPKQTGHSFGPAATLNDALVTDTDGEILEMAQSQWRTQLNSHALENSNIEKSEEYNRHVDLIDIFCHI